MKVIDQQLGGKTPLDLIVQLEKSETDTPQQEEESTDVKNWKMKKSLILLKRGLRNRQVKHSTGLRRKNGAN
ncbi:MAG: hypothetical protein Ct9H300mP28_37170 [Pseudomonadota bacterium]|nr:MAG: hypothetical protein Ct9H300mP28_37170 [Pseudomonadota bacterium]